MERRTLIALLATAPVALLAACGSDGTTLPPVDEPDPTAPESEPGDDTGAADGGGDDDEAGPDDGGGDDDADPFAGAPGEPILSITYEGGFTTREYAFQNPPTVLVTDDGRVMTLEQGDLMALPRHAVRSISAAGIEQLRTALSEAGMFADVEYERNDLIADADTTTLVVTDASGNEYRHEAYALSFGPGLPGEPRDDDTDGPRAQLAELVGTLERDLDSIVDELGAFEPWMPEALQLQVDGPFEPGSLGGGAPVEWPSSADVALAATGGFTCVESSDAALLEVFAAAPFGVTFVDPSTPDAEYSVAARPAYPGRSCDT